MARALVAVAFVVAVAAPRLAAAQCERVTPSIWVSPPPSIRLPARPRLFIFDPGNDVRAIHVRRSGNVSLSHADHVVDDRAGMRVWSVDVPARDGAFSLQLELGTKIETFDYTIGPPVEPVAKVVELESTVSDECDDTTSLPRDLGIRIDGNAEAYRLRWANRGLDAIVIVAPAEVLHVDNYLVPGELNRFELDALFADGAAAAPSAGRTQRREVVVARRGRRGGVGAAADDAAAPPARTPELVIATMHRRAWSAARGT